MRSPHPLALVLLGVVLGLGVPAARPTTAAAPLWSTAGAQAGVRVRLASQYTAADVAEFIAADRGYFQQEGVDVEFVTFSNASEMVPALATDQVEAAGLGGNVATWNAVARGVPMKLVLDKGSFRPGFGLQALGIRKQVYDAGRGRSVDDLQGLTLALTPPGAPSTDACVMATGLARRGVSFADLTIVPMPFPDMVPALANGSIDGALIAEPFLTYALRQNTLVRLIGQEELYPNATIAVVAFSPAFYGNRAAAKGFARAYIRAIRDYQAAVEGRSGEADRAQLDEIIARYTRIDVATVREMAPTGFSPNGLPNVDSLRGCYQFFRDQGAIATPIADAAMAAVWGTDLVEEALAEIGRLPDN